MENINEIINLLKEDEEMIRQDTLGNDTSMCSCCYGVIIYIIFFDIFT